MKNEIFALAAFLFTGTFAFAQNVGINATGTPPNNSAMLDIDASNKGLLIPRVALTSATDITTIPSPATSLLVYNTGTGGLTPAGYYYWDGSKWVKFLIIGTPSDAWLTTGNSGTSPSSNFIGTIDNTSLVFRTNNTEQMRITSGGNVGIGTATPASNLHLHSSSSNTILRISSPAGFVSGVQVGVNNWYIGADPGDNVVIYDPSSGISVFTMFVSGQPRMSRFRRNSGVTGTGTNNDGPTNIIIESGTGGFLRFYDWPSGWAGGLSTWDICGASTYMWSYVARSDRSYKKNIKELTFEALKDKFMALKPVQYHINTEELKVDDPDRLRFGFIANDVEKIFPNLVINAGLPANIKRGLEYDGIIPILVKMVQEQQAIIEHQNREIELLKQMGQEQQAIIESQKNEIEQLKKKSTEIDNLKAEIDFIKSQLNADKQSSNR
jgi:hypothetical protein